MVYRSITLGQQMLSSDEQSLNIGTWDLNLETGVLRWSDRIGLLFAHTDGGTETSLDDFLSAVYIDDRQVVKDAIMNCIDQGAVLSMEHRTVWPDGTVRWLSQKGDVVRDPDGQARHMLGVVQDVTERKLAEDKLLMMNGILQKTASGVAIETILGEIIAGVEELMQGGICSLLLLEGNQLYSGAANRLPDFYNAAIDGLEIGDGVGSCGTAAFRNERVIVENILEHPYWQPFAELVKKADVAACWSEPIRFTDEMPFGTFAIYYREPRAPSAQELSIIHDAAQLASFAMLRERHEKSLNQAKDDAIRANRAKTDFLSKMSHELRTPLNGIMGFSQLLEMEGTLDAQQSDTVMEIHRAGEHLLALINDIIDLSRIESGNIEVSAEAVDVDSVIEHASNLIASLAAAKRITVVHNRLSDGADTCVQADAMRLRQVVLNLLSNAIKYNRDGGEVRIHVCRPDEAHVRIDVEDTGIGITEQDLSQLFTPFNRLGAEKTTVEGTGIGMVITKQLLELMGGSLEVQSQPGQGSTFSVTLQRAAENMRVSGSTGIDPMDDPAPDPSTPVRTVVYIEDDAVNQKVLERALKRRPHLQLASATTPEAGLALVKSLKPALVLLDINLPGMTGFKLLEILRQDPATRSIPVIAVTANVMTDDIERGRKSGFDEYLTKPIDFRIFYRVLDQYLA